MGSSSNFGNMFSMAGAALFLPFLPMLPTQVLLNNLLYDLSEVGVPFDNVDPEALEKPVHWDIRLVERFMLVLGPVSSLFDFLTFFALIQLFGAGEAMFQTGWFIESLATQIFSHLRHQDARPPLAEPSAPSTRGIVCRRGRRRAPYHADAARQSVRVRAAAARVLPVSHRGSCSLSVTGRGREAAILPKGRSHLGVGGAASSFV